jgi:hypothetical protein
LEEAARETESESSENEQTGSEEEVHVCNAFSLLEQED